MSRKIEDLTSSMQAKYKEFCYGMNCAGIDFIVTCTSRTQEEQDALYAKGRTTPGPKVTWTRNSPHIGGNAFDIVIIDKATGKPNWNTDLDEDHDGVSDYLEAGKIGETVGLVWGGRWTKTPDYPHFQDPNWNKS